jgi:hypothetical protein
MNYRYHTCILIRSGSGFRLAYVRWDPDLPKLNVGP